MTPEEFKKLNSLDDKIDALYEKLIEKYIGHDRRITKVETSTSVYKWFTGAILVIIVGAVFKGFIV